MPGDRAPQGQGRVMSRKIAICAVELATANLFVASLHRHHPKAVGHRFSLGAIADGLLVGVAIVGRPVARKTDYLSTVEVTRLCTNGHPNACSALYGAAARAAQALGYQRIQTFILATEPGTSLKAAGWICEGSSKGGSWSQPSRPRVSTHATAPKTRWVKKLGSPVPFEMPKEIPSSGQIDLFAE